MNSAKLNTAAAPEKIQNCDPSEFARHHHRAPVTTARGSDSVWCRIRPAACDRPAPRGGKAQERPIPSREGKTYSLLTHALVDALNRAPTNEKFEVTSDSIAAHIRQSWSDICGADPADPPEFSLPGITPITIVKRPTVAQDLDVSGWGPGEPVELLRGDTEPLATLIRLIGDKVQVSWKTRADETIAIVNGHITINLVAGFCILRRGTVQRAFQSGEANVVI